LPINPIAVLSPYQKIEDLPKMFTRTRAIAERIIAEMREKYSGLLNCSPNSVKFIDKITA